MPSALPRASGVQVGWIRDNLHLNHGPIDLLLHAQGDADKVELAYDKAIRRFDTLLTELVDELPLLRRELPRGETPTADSPQGEVAGRMFAACQPFRSARLSPMAAVAGAVADHMLEVLNQTPGLRRAWVNNGGDIAFSLAPGTGFVCGLIADIRRAGVQGDLHVCEADPVRGIATSGRATQAQGGRSFSLGIADAVTVLATTAATADAAATLIANRVDLPEHPGINRRAAVELDPDSDLGSRAVTLSVPALTDNECRQALERGAEFARGLQSRGQIHFAVLFLQNVFIIVGNDSCLKRRLEVV